jgi:hypothetical protein
VCAPALEEAERTFAMTTITLTARFARYLLTSLATIAFGMNMQ